VKYLSRFAFCSFLQRILAYVSCDSHQASVKRSDTSRFIVRMLSSSCRRSFLAAKTRLRSCVTTSLSTGCPWSAISSGSTSRHIDRFFSTHSSFDEPNPSLFGASPLQASTVSSDATSIPSNEADRDIQLRADIKVMGSLLGRIIQTHEGAEVLEKVETMRGLAKTWRDQGAGRDPSTKQAADQTFQNLAAYAKSFTDAELFTVSRAFTHFLAIANAAESHHRGRRLKQSRLLSDESSGALYPKPDSVGGVLPSLLAQGHDADAIYDALTSQTTELVLTAHPTEVNRRTILNKKRRIQRILTMADQQRQLGASSVFEQAELNDALYREISSIWLSDEVSRIKPSPETEAEKGTLVLETVLWEAVPTFLRKLDATTREFLGKPLPLDSSPIRFASWMGGDRDGNPNVKPDTTRQVCLRNRQKAATLFARNLRTLEAELSLTTCSREVREVVGAAREPYRVFLQPMIRKMEATTDWAAQELAILQKRRSGDKSASGIASVASTNVEGIYLDQEEFRAELLTIYRSLQETGNEVAASGILTDIIRNLSSFGLTLIPLDVRQESDRHEEALDAITRYLGLGSYIQWDEQTRVSWLTTQISSKRPLLRAGVWYEHPDYFSPTAIDTLEISRMIAEQHEGSLGAYVISQATSASDVLAVLLLQLDAGVKKPLRVAPLFETLDDLNGAADTMRQLFSLPAYMGTIGGKQEVMIGYSDSAKDAGRMAATWAQYETQETLAKLAKEFGVDMTFFHGKGGTVGRGGNPQTFTAIMAHAPKTINGHFRVTEQGEMISQNFGYADRAERTMDIYTAAVLAEKLSERPKVKDEWRSMMKILSDISCEAYRQVVRKDERFVPYFRSATPELELSNLNIGSRPAKRKATGGVESLRAIPWNFAWTQTRFNLPTWLGVGDAIGQLLKSDRAPLLRELYREARAFQTMVDLVEMVLAKSEPAIAAHYDSVLVKDPKAKELGTEVRQLHMATEEAILDLTEHKKLGENNAVLQRALVVRNPYVDCLNILQVETLDRLRQVEEGKEDKVLKDALLTTITGVANGMGNTG
jgi:phosphoenolpyruvate carboxylase